MRMVQRTQKMTVEINLKCDGLNCFNEKEIYETTDMAIERAGWLIDEENDCHYCPKCKPIVERILAVKNE